MDENYWGFGPAHIDGQGIRRKGEFPKAVKEISKSVLADIDELTENEEYYFDSFGTRRKRKKQVTELTDVTVNEISFVDSPATRKTFTMIKSLDKGDEETMEEEKQDTGWEKVPANEVTKIRETIAILNKYDDLSDDIKRANLTLTKYFGEREPAEKVEKSNFKWSNNTQRTLLGYSDSDLEKVEEEDLEIEKSSAANPFPSLANVFNRNARTIEEIVEDENIEERFC